jgi:hypothetical protein
MEAYILDGKTPRPVDIQTWAKWEAENPKNKIIKQTTLPDGTLISTVFLGLDHAFPRGSTPVLFETMIFGGEHDHFQDRYFTYDEAEIGHEKAIQLCFS